MDGSSPWTLRCWDGLGPSLLLAGQPTTLLPTTFPCCALQLMCDLRANTPKDRRFLARHARALVPHTFPGWLVCGRGCCCPPPLQLSRYNPVPSPAGPPNHLPNFLLYPPCYAGSGLCTGRFLLRVGWAGVCCSSALCGRPLGADGAGGSCRCVRCAGLHRCGRSNLRCCLGMLLCRGLTVMEAPSRPSALASCCTHPAPYLSQA